MSMNQLAERESAELNKVTGNSGIIGFAKRLDRAAWLTWWAGTILIILSWINVVSNRVGWLGFGIACAATITSVVARRYWRIPN